MLMQEIKKVSHSQERHYNPVVVAVAVERIFEKQLVQVVVGRFVEASNGGGVSVPPSNPSNLNLRGFRGSILTPPSLHQICHGVCPAMVVDGIQMPPHQCSTMGQNMEGLGVCGIQSLVGEMPANNGTI
ncbi:hypothetical protein TSMEX_000411 [Taenia solium]|eukprot:TsM_000754200 transcript=TsM_000754200 gene=TsM_000754200